MSQINKVLQLSLWSLLDESKMNIVALYDLAPKFTYRNIRGRERASGEERIIEKEFMHGDRRFVVVIKPAILKAQTGEVVYKFPSSREKFVEYAIRRLSSQRDRMVPLGDNNIRFFFSIEEVKNELARINHSYSYNEIREAIVVLNETKLTIMDDELPRKNVFSSSIFPSIGIRGRDSDESTFVDFNSMIVESIKRIGFQQVDYDILTQVRDHIGQWLVKKIYIDNMRRVSTTYNTSYMSVVSSGGIPEHSSKSRTVAALDEAIAELQTMGLLAFFEKNRIVKKNGAIIDVFYEMRLSESFLSKIKKMRESLLFNAGFVGKLGPAMKRGFVEITAEDEALINKRRRRELHPRRLRSITQEG